MSFWDRLVHTRRGLCILGNRTREVPLSFLKFLKSKVTQFFKNNLKNFFDCDIDEINKKQKLSFFQQF